MRKIPEEILNKEITPVEGLTSTLLRNFRIFPFYENGHLIVLVPSIKEIIGADFIFRKLETSGEVYQAEESLILELIQKYYESPEEVSETELSEEAEDEEYLRDLASEAPVIRLVNRLLREAVEARATDIHIEPQKNFFIVRFRVDGLLQEKEKHPRNLHAPVISRIKLMSGLNIAEHRLPQDGRFRFRVGGRDLDVRVSIIPTVNGEAAVLRLLVQQQELLSLENLGFDPEVFSLFKKIISSPNGIVLITGPTGSGKTTTLYATLVRLNRPEVKIVTIEDPVEYQLSGISQIQIKPEIGLTFASALRAILRHDPDIILVGEIRDLETAEIAVQAALTGHLVFSTLHTRDALSAVTRLSDMGIERYLIAASVVGLVAQRLVRKVCENCAEKVDPPALLKESLKQLKFDEPINYRRGRGCEHCQGSGYKGRIAIQEVFPVDDELRILIHSSDSDQHFYRWAKNKGYRSMFEDGLIKSARGLTTLEEVLRSTHA